MALGPVHIVVVKIKNLMEIITNIGNLKVVSRQLYPDEKGGNEAQILIFPSYIYSSQNFVQPACHFADEPKS